MYDGNTTSPNNYNSSIHHVKLEKGTTATDWCKSDDDLVAESRDGLLPASVDNNFSWTFSPTSGLYMYNGKSGDPNRTEVFKIYRPTDSSGNSLPYTAYLNGEIYANKGKIGGWEISTYKLQNYQGTPFKGTVNGKEYTYYPNSFCMQTQNEAGTHINAISIGKCATDDWSNSSFRVTLAGKLYAKDADISGTINATKGTIGNTNGAPGWTIDGYRIYSGTLGTNGFHMCSKASAVGSVIGTHFGADEETGWSLGIGSNFGVDYLGNLYARGGKIGKFFIRGDGLSSLKTSTSNHAPSDMTLTASALTFYSVSGGSDALPSEVTLTATGVSAYLLGLPDTTTQTSWVGIINMVNNKSSDARLKKDIYSLDERFDIFFDCLRPSQYKYINGSSGRTHTGFIAQEVVEALTSANLSTQDFAAVMLEKVSENESYWSLRRDEFVSLNTWQIQKLKPRMTTAEEKIAQLELQISQLTTELENLKKTQNPDIISTEE